MFCAGWVKNDKMNDYEKAIDLLNKVSGRIISQAHWENTSHEQRVQLQRKVLIVIREVEESQPSHIGLSNDLEQRRELSRIYWVNVRKFLNKIVETKKIAKDND